MENQDDALCVRRGITDGLSGQQAPELHCHLPRVGCERAGREGVTGTLRGEGEPVCHLSEEAKWLLTGFTTKEVALTLGDFGHAEVEKSLFRQRSWV